jgi:hypothetical protein
VTGSLWVLQGLCVVWLLIVGYGVCVFAGCESVTSESSSILGVGR